MTETTALNNDALRLNDLDHGTNLVYVERAITYVQEGMPHDACLMLEAFGNAERVRLDEKLRLMLSAGIERWPSPHQARQHQLMQALSAAIERHSPLRKREAHA